MIATTALAMASLCMVLTGTFGLLFAANPAKGMAAANHLPEQLPLVMSDRYIGTAALLLGVILWGDWWLLFWFTAVVGTAGLGDVYIYARAGKPFLPHLIAAFLYGAAAFLSLSAHLMQGS